ncbi:MAG: hypothetical protein ACLU3D_00570 [Acutalibacteraceae bacterium]
MQLGGERAQQNRNQTRHAEIKQQRPGNMQQICPLEWKQDEINRRIQQKQGGCIPKRQQQQNDDLRHKHRLRPLPSCTHALVQTHFLEPRAINKRQKQEEDENQDSQFQGDTEIRERLRIRTGQADCAKYEIHCRKGMEHGPQRK